MYFFMLNTNTIAISSKIEQNMQNREELVFSPRLVYKKRRFLVFVTGNIVTLNHVSSCVLPRSTRIRCQFQSWYAIPLKCSVELTRSFIIRLSLIFIYSSNTASIKCFRKETNMLKKYQNELNQHDLRLNEYSVAATNILVATQIF